MKWAVGPKRYLGSRHPTIGSMDYGGGEGSKLKVQGTDSYPVNERMLYVCITKTSKLVTSAQGLTTYTQTIDSLDIRKS